MYPTFVSTFGSDVTRLARNDTATKPTADIINGTATTLRKFYTPAAVVEVRRSLMSFSSSSSH
jgi:hypothetical protein